MVVLCLVAVFALSATTLVVASPASASCNTECKEQKEKEKQEAKEQKEKEKAEAKAQKEKEKAEAVLQKEEEKEAKIREKREALASATHGASTTSTRTDTARTKTRNSRTALPASPPAVRKAASSNTAKSR